MPEWVNNNNLMMYLQSAILIFLVILILVQQRRLSASNKHLQHYQELLRDNNGDNLETIILAMKSELNDKSQELKKLSGRLNNLEGQFPELVQNIGLVRFKGFEDVGGDLSFSAAILNGQGDGMVITALHARDDTRVYAKKVEKYVSAYPLSEEEINAIRQSQKKVN